MRQEQFERARAERWAELETLFERLGHRDASAASRFPGLYRRVCQDLALARDRHFSSLVVDRLERLVLRGHQVLYGARLADPARIVDFVARDFPHAVRAEWRLGLLLALLFFGSGALVIGGIQANPELVFSFLDRHTLAGIERAYDPAHAGDERVAESDVAMFGYYIWNNISIAFRSFASGLLFGVGTLFIVVYNALFIGAIFGHLVQVGFAEPLVRFTIGHSSLELPALLIAAVAGMRLGLAGIAPGAHTRGAALRRAARRAIPLVYGSGAMLALAAAIEAFWSPRAFPLAVKLGFGATLWGMVVLYFALAGRGRVRES